MAKKRGRRKERKKFTTWFKELSIAKKILLILGIVILIALMVVVVYIASKFSKLNTEKIADEEIHVNEFEEEEVGVGYTNFVLFGGDSRTGDVDKNLNTDAIIVVSLNNETKEVKMVSVYRDTLLDLSNGKIQKCNAAYSSGGATQAINMLNMNLDLNIQKYVTVDFGAVADVIDMLGGIEVDVSEAEWQAVNMYIDETGMVAGKDAVHLTHAGVQTLDGVQATTYARIRKGVGDDYARVERQRLVIEKTVEKAMQADFSTLNKMVDQVLPKVATNLTTSEILKYAKSITKYQIGESTSFPFDIGSGVIAGKGDCIYPVTLYSNVQQLHEFLYGTVDYQPSQKVQSISNEIAYVTGSGRSSSSSSDDDSNSSSTSSHTHSWVPVTETVHHDATGHYEDVLVKEAGYEEVTKEKTTVICNTCGQDVTGYVEGHLTQTGHEGTTTNTEFVTEQIPYDAVYESKWVEDTAAYDETVITGYKCSCGATK